MGGKVIVLYDVRRIQSYIFRTSRLKDAIGASALIDGIVEKALKHGIGIWETAHEKKLSTDLVWFDC